MSKQKRPFCPAFINRIDDYLLKNAPEIWSARAHLVLYYGLLFMSVLAFLSFIVPDDPRSNSGVAFWIVFVSLISIIGLVLWLMFLLRFNVFKRYGLTSASNRLRTWLLYFTSVGILVFFCYVPPIVESIRANSAYSDNELAVDLNKMNSLICQLSYDSLPHDWINDTVIVVNSTEGRYENVEVIGDVEEVTTSATVMIDSAVFSYKPAFRLMDTTEFASKKLGCDSMMKINDSVFVFSECPSYEFITDPGLSSYSDVKMLNSRALYYQIIQHYTKKEEPPLVQEMDDLIKKYKYYSNDDYSYYTGVEANNGNHIQGRFSTNNITRSIENIYERKHSFAPNHLEWQIRVWFYITFCISLLVFNFRHSTKKAFFLSILTCVLLSILTGLILAFSNGEESSMFGSYLFYFALFAFFSFGTFQNRTRNIVSGISINVFSWMLYFLPLLLTSMYYEGQQSAYNELVNPAYSFDYETMKLHFFYAEIIGIIIFIIAIPTLLHRFYLRWYALPEE
jgi:hypothetical protein